MIINNTLPTQTINIGGNKTPLSRTGVMGPTQPRWYGISISLDSIPNLPSQPTYFINQDIHVTDINSALIQTYDELLEVLNTHPSNISLSNSTSTPTTKVVFSMVDGNILATAHTSATIRIQVTSIDGFRSTVPGTAVVVPFRLNHVTLDSGDCVDLWTSLADFTDIL